LQGHYDLDRAEDALSTRLAQEIKPYVMPTPTLAISQAV